MVRLVSLLRRTGAPRIDIPPEIFADRVALRFGRMAREALEVPLELKRELELEVGAIAGGGGCVARAPDRVCRLPVPTPDPAAVAAATSSTWSSGPSGA